MYRCVLLDDRLRSEFVFHNPNSKEDREVKIHLYNPGVQELLLLLEIRLIQQCHTFLLKDKCIPEITNHKLEFGHKMELILLVG